MSDTRLRSLSDDALLGRLAELSRESRRVESDLVAHIAEVDRRRLYLREAAPSMFAYCTDVLHLSEAEAYLRIAAARASREHPMLLAMLAEGRLHLTAVAKLAPHLTPENRDRVLERASHKSKRAVEELVAELAPRPDAASSMRKLPSPPAVRLAPVELRPDGVDAPLEPKPIAALPLERPASIEPLAPERYRVQFTASAMLQDKLRRLQALMPGADLAAAVEQAVTEKLERLEARRFARTNRPRKAVAEARDTPPSRYIPAPVRRAVDERDGGRCRYVDPRGARCTARGQLEFHHRQPYALRGPHSTANLSLLCRAHNQYLAELDYGKAKMEGLRGSRARDT